MTLLHLAAKAGQTTAIRYLLENRRLNVNAKVSEHLFVSLCCQCGAYFDIDCSLFSRLCGFFTTQVCGTVTLSVVCVCGTLTFEHLDLETLWVGESITQAMNE